MIDRRKSNDFWARLLWILNVVAWLIMGFILFLFHKAQPEYETLFDRFYHLDLRTEWDLQYLYYLIILVIFGVAIGISGVVLGIYRGRRRNDHKKALLLTGIISLVLLWFSLYLI